MARSKIVKKAPKPKTSKRWTRKFPDEVSDELLARCHKLEAKDFAHLLETALNGYERKFRKVKYWTPPPPPRVIEEPASYDRVMKLARELYRVEQLELRALDVADRLKRRRQYLALTVLPEAVDALPGDLQEIELREPNDQVIVYNDAERFRIVVEDSFHPRVPKDDEPEAFKWLIKEKEGGLIQTVVSLVFKRGERAEAVRYMEMLKREFPERPYTTKESINYQTFKKWCKDRLAAGKDIPGMFGVFNRREAFVETIHTEAEVAQLAERPKMLYKNPDPEAYGN